MMNQTDFNTLRILIHFQAQTEKEYSTLGNVKNSVILCHSQRTCISALN